MDAERTTRSTCAALALLLGLCLSRSDAAAAEPAHWPVTIRPISEFSIGSGKRIFGKLEYLGGFSYTSADPRVGALSAIRFRPDGTHFIGVLDKGFWMTGRIERDRDGTLTGLADLAVSPMLNRRGQAERAKPLMDAEGLAIGNGELLVSYEGQHRIDAYPDPGFMDAKPARTIPYLIPRRELRTNQSLETLAMAPAGGPLGAVPVTVAERSLDENGNMLAAILDGPRKGVFTIVRNDPWDATDGAFLPNGDFLLLERRFRFSDGIGMRIRRIAADDLKPGAVVDGEVLIDADMSTQIDNMEGLDTIEAGPGDTRIIVVSDDNQSFLQRNLMLEFRLAD